MDTNTIMILVILAALLIAFVVLRGRGSSKARSDFSAPTAPLPESMPAAPAAPAVSAAASAPQVEAGIPPEVVAAITAAIYAMGSGRYVLKAVRRADRSVWAQAGAADVTAPF